MDGSHAIQPNATFDQGHGNLTLSSELSLLADVFIEGDSGQGNVSIYSSPTGNDLGAFVFALSPGPIEAPGPSGEPGGRIFLADRSLSPAEGADLHTGSWWAVYATPAAPNGQLRGQITLVPEPSISALLGAGGFLLWFCGRHRKDVK